MRVVQHGFLYQVTFLATIFPVNCYLVEEENGLTLIDAALPFSANGILTAARNIGKPITKIVLTHAHEDHVGALDRLKEKLPDVPVYISVRDNRLLGGDYSLDREEHQTPIKGGVPKNMKTRATILLKEGDRVGSIAAIEAPGHTPGSMAFIDTRTKALIVGDAFQTRGGIAVSGDLRPWFPFPAMGTWSKPSALESAKKLLGYQPTLLAVGHGGLLENPLTAMEKAIKMFEMKL